MVDGLSSGPVEFATTADGVSIAYQRFGNGPPLLRLPHLFTPLRLHEEVGSVGGGVDRLMGQRVSLVLYDLRGTGWSDRSATDCSMDAALVDLLAVAEALGPGPVPVLAAFEQGMVALRFAADHPERVSHLILRSTFASGRDWLDVGWMQALRATLRSDWEFFTATVIRTMHRLEGDDADHAVNLIRQELTPEICQAQLDALADYDASDALGSIRAPTLLIESDRNESHQVAQTSQRSLVSQIPSTTLIHESEPSESVDAIFEFIEATQPMPAHSAFRTIMFTDLKSSTELTQQVGDEAAQEVLNIHDLVVRDALMSHGGVEIKHTGDGIMAAFDSATDASMAAGTIAGALTARGVQVRVGLNAGEPVARGGDLFGAAVQLAARVCDRASSGEVLATGVVHDLTAGKHLQWSARGEFKPKGFDEPFAIYALEPS